MKKVSIIIPARGESMENLSRTIRSIQDSATGEYEVLVGYDGKDGSNIETAPIQAIFDYSKADLSIVEFPRVVGIKTNINALASMATGKYIYKSDAHCRFGKGFDEILTADMQDDWIMMPRFKIIKDDWSIQMRDGEEEFYDYFYLCCPFTDPRGFRFKAGGHWKERTLLRFPGVIPSSTLEMGKDIDETPQIHGSGWIMTKDHYFNGLGGFPNIDPHGHAQEPIWLALKNQLMGGKCMVNKKTWYAHLHQSHNSRGYSMDRHQENLSYKIAAEHFVGNKGNYLHDFEWFIEKFYPMPTWEPSWRDQLEKWRNDNA